MTLEPRDEPAGGPPDPERAPPASRMTPEPMDEARLADLLAVMDPDRLGAHVAGLRAALDGLAGAGASPLPEAAETDAWTGLGRRAHAAAGHAQLLGFPGLGRLLNALEASAKQADARAAGLALAALRAQLDAGAPRLPPL